jgi:hypothetical protein
MDSRLTRATIPVHNFGLLFTADICFTRFTQTARSRFGEALREFSWLGPTDACLQYCQPQTMYRPFETPTFASNGQ